MVLALVAASTPLALGAETLVRRLFFPPAFQELRAWLGPSLSPWAWACAPLALLAGVAALLLQPRVRRRALAKLAPGDPDAAGKAELETLMICTSVPQLPALLATVGFMLGADLRAVAAAIAAGVAGVLLQGRSRP